MSHFTCIFLFCLVSAFVKLNCAQRYSGSGSAPIESILNKLILEFDTVKNQLDRLEARLKVMQSFMEQKTTHDDSRCLIRDITDSINNHRFQLAEEKLIELSDRKQVSSIVHDIYVSSPVNVGIILEFAKSLNHSEFQYLVLHSVLEEMRSSGKTDPTKLISLIQTLERENFRQKDEKVKAKALELIKNAVEDLKVASVSILKTAMIANKYEMNREVDSLANALFEFRIDVSNDVMDNVVDSVFGVVAAGRILDNISSHKHISQVIAGLTAIFNRFNFAGNLNNDATIHLASHLHKLQQRDQYDKIGKDLKDKVDKVIQQLPKCATNLFFSKYICFWNHARQQYMYAASVSISHDHERRSIYTWFPGDIKPGALWEVERMGDAFFFKNKDHVNEYMYSAIYDYNKDMRYVFNWIPGNNTDPQSAWAVELDDDFCYIKTTFHNEYLFAPTVNYDQLNNWVFTWKPGTLVRSPEFQWQIRGCG